MSLRLTASPSRSQAPEELGRDHVVQARPLQRLERLAHHDLALAAGVDLGVVEEVDAARPTRRPASRVAAAGVDLVVVRDPGAERQLADLQAAAAETSVLHGGGPCCVSTRAARVAEARACRRRRARLQCAWTWILRRPTRARRRARLAAALRAAGGGVAILADRARAAAQRRQRPPVTATTAVPLPDRLRRARQPGWCCDATAARRCAAAPKDPETRDLGRLAPRPRGRAGGARRRRGVRRSRRSTAACSSGWPTSPRSGSRSAARPGVGAQVDGWLATLRARARSGVEAPATQRDLAPLLAEMRAASRTPPSSRRCAAPRTISAGAHARAMRFCGRALPRRAERHACASTRSRPSCCTSSAATARRARPTRSIVAAGANACVLHYAAGDAAAARRRAVPDRRRLRARRLRQRHHPHLPGRRPLHAGAARAVRHRAGRAAGGRRRHPPRRAPARRAPRRGARAHAGHARHRPARPRRGRRRSTT